MRLALFDFDGTLTRKDTLQEFIIFSVGLWRYLFGLLVLSPMLILYLVGIISNDRAKEIMIAHFFKGWRATYFRDLAGRYSLSEIDKIIRPKAMERIMYHQLNNDRIIVVSASISAWVEPWCTLHNIEVLATTLEEKEGIITGRFGSKNCNGIEKTIRINKILNLENYDEVFVYGDSSGDYHMLELATNGNGFTKCFN